MSLFLSNDDVKTVLTMDVTIEVLRRAYLQISRGEGVCRPRIDLQIPTSDPKKIYQWGTMEAGEASGYFAIRMKSDVIYQQEYGGTRTLEKYCLRPGTFCGLIFLFRVDTGEPLALLNDGYLQHMRVGADSAIGVDYMARKEASVVGMFGSGGMARTHIESIRLVRPIRRVQVYSPTRAHREEYAAEMAARFGIEAVSLDDPADVYKGADIVCGCTDSNVAVIEGHRLEPGTHVTSVGGRPDEATFERLDRFLRFGNATPRLGAAEGVTDEYLVYAAPALKGKILQAHKHSRGVVGLVPPERVVYLADLLAGKGARSTSAEITYSERGNIQGAQFYSVAGRVYEAAKEKGLGKEIPTEWFLQDIRD